jgi:hypothetical protein
LRPACEIFQLRSRGFAQERYLRPEFVRVAMGALAPAELQINVGAGLTQPNGPLRTAKLEKPEFHFQHFDDSFEIPGIETVRDVIQFHDKVPTG